MANLELIDVKKTYDKLQTFVPIQDYQIDHYKNRFLKYINPGFRSLDRSPNLKQSSPNLYFYK